jgi:hypothetical protein
VIAVADNEGLHRGSLLASGMLHLAAIILFTVSFPFFKKEFEIPPPVSVELLTISDVSETTKMAPKPTPKPPEKKPEMPKPEEKKPQPAPTNKSAEAKAPVLKPPEKVEEKPKPVEKVIDENAPPEKKVEKKPEKKVEEKKPEPKKDFASILKNLADEKPKPAPPQVDPMPDKMAEPAEGRPVPLGQRMTMSEMDALRHQLEGCWNVPYGAKDAETLTVDIFMVISPARTLQQARIVDTGRYNSDPFFRAMADSAMRAVRHPNCSPFDLPPDKYETWKTITVTFDPSLMF